MDKTDAVRSGMVAGTLLLGATLLGGAGLLDGCASRPLQPMAAVHAPACTDVVFPIYFAPRSDEITAGAQQVIANAATQVKGCRIGYVNVLGLTDAAGTREENLALSKRRADKVARALADAGVSTPKFEVEGVGENGAISEKGRPVPLRRKTEVIIHPLPA